MRKKRIIGGVEYIPPRRPGDGYCFRWQGKKYSKPAWVKYIGLDSHLVSQITNGSIAAYLGKTSDGRLFPMMTYVQAIQYAPKGIMVNTLRNRLKEGCFIDVPLSEEESNAETLLDFRRFRGFSEIKALEKMETYHLANKFARLSRPKGMIDEAKEWQQPAW